MEIISLNTSLFFFDEEDEWGHKIILESLCDRKAYMFIHAVI